MKTARLPLLTLVCLLALACSSVGQTISRLVIFGDSLSDTGNFRDSNILGIPGTTYNYDNGRFTDGPRTSPAARKYSGVWHEQLAPLIGLPVAKNSKAGGLNYAYGAATTADTTENYPVIPGINVKIKNLGAQITDYLSNHTPTSSDLILLWAGGNDILDDPALALTAATNIDLDLRRLIGAGGRVFVVPNLPPLGSIPEGQSNATALNEATRQFNSTLAIRLLSLQASYADLGITLHIFQPDIFAASQVVLKDPQRFGLKNISTPARGNNSIDPDTWLLWDTLHPTTKGHNLIALICLNQLTAR